MIVLNPILHLFSTYNFITHSFILCLIALLIIKLFVRGK